MKKGVIVLITILSILVLGMGSYIVYDKFFDNKEMKKEVKEETKKIEDENEATNEIDINDDIVKNLGAMVEEYTVGVDLQNVIPYDETKEVIIKDAMSDALKGAVAFNLSKIDDRYLDKSDDHVENGYRITDEGVSIIKNNFIKLFGYDGFKEAGYCPTVKLIDNNYYEIYGCGYGPNINTSAISVKSAYTENSDIILEAKVVFALWDGPTDDNTFEGLILSKNRYDEEKQNITNDLDENTYQDIISLDSSDLDEFYNSLKKYVADNSELLDTYIYRFKKNDNSYYLYSVKKA